MPLSEPKGIPRWTARNPWLVAILSSVAMAALRVALDPVLGDATPFITFFVAVAVTAWLGGLWPGLLATAVSAILASEVVFEPRLAFEIPNSQQATGLALFGIAGALFSLICEALHETRRVHERQQAWWRVTLGSIGDAVIATDVEGRVTYLNAVACELTGWDSKQAMGVPLERVFDIVNETTRAIVENPVAKVMREGRAVGLANHTVLRRRDGSELPIDDSAAPIRGANGALAGIVLVFHDVSERRELERGRRERERQLQLVTDIAPVFLAHCDAGERFCFVSASYAALFGRAPGDLVGRPVAEVLEAGMYEHARPYIQQALSGTPANFELEIPGREGAPARILNARYAPERDDRGSVTGFVAALTDITEQKRAAEEFTRTRRLLERIADTTPDVVYVYDLEHDRNVYINHAVTRVLGWTLEEVAALDRGMATALGHPDDAPTVASANRRAAELGDGELQTYQLRMRHADGRWRLLHCREMVFERGPHGEAKQMIGIAQDVTEARDQEAALQTSQARLQLALNAAHMFAWEVDGVSGTITTTERGSEYFGGTRCTAEQIRNAIPPEDRDRVDRTWAIAAATGERYECEHRVLAPDGRVRWLHAMGISEQRADGRPGRLVGVSVDVTERHASDEQLRYQLDLTRSITDNATTAIFMLDERGRCTFMNPAAVTMTGFSFDEVSGTALHDRMHHHRPDGRLYPIAECPLDGPDALPALRDHRDTFFRKSGEMYPVSCNAQVIMRDGVATGTVLEVRDLTAELEADREARERSEQVRGLAEAALRLTTATDTNGVLQVVSDEARRLIRAHQAVTTNVRDADWSSAAFVASMSDRYASWRGYERRPDGSGIYRLVCERNTPMRLTQEELQAHPAFRGFGVHRGEHPPIRGWLAAPLVARDGSNIGVLQLSDRLEGDFTADDEAVLVQLAQMASAAIENIRLVDDLRESDRRKDEFLSILAHELRNPLAPIRNGLHLLKLAAGDPSRATTAREMMERQTSHLVRLIDDLMDLTRVSQGRLALQKTRLPLMSAVHAALETVAPQFTEGGQSLALIAPDEPLIVDADETRLAQALGNILNNAAKYTPRGGHVSVTVTRDGTEAILTIEDSGVGIPAPMLERIFEMFTQVDRSLERARGGLGIGLAIVHRLIAQHGGSVVAESEGQDRGSRFIVRLPLVGTPRDTAAVDEGGPALPAVVPRRVLVVDDNRDAAESLQLMLERMGHESFVAHDGLTAIERAEALRPDVILMDIGMPGLNGFDACQRIRAASWGRRIRMVACTGWGQPEDRQRAIEAGFDDHRVKPMDPASLATLLEGAYAPRSAAPSGDAGATSVA